MNSGVSLALFSVGLLAVAGGVRHAQRKGGSAGRYTHYDYNEITHDIQRALIEDTEPTLTDVAALASRLQLPEVIGLGSYRVVFDLGNDRVLKVARSTSTADSRSIRTEAHVYKTAPAALRPYLVPVLDVDPDSQWLVMQYARPAAASQPTLPGHAERLASRFGITDLASTNLTEDGRILDYGDAWPDTAADPRASGSATRGRKKAPIGWTAQGDPIYKPRGHKRHEHKGLTVNPQIRLPPAPGPWVDESACTCGATYDKHRAGVTFGAARTALEQAWPKQQGARFITTGPVLYMMRAIKLDDWYMSHHGCGMEWQMAQSRRVADQRRRRQRQVVRQIAQQQGWEVDPQYVPPAAHAKVPF